jgi:PAS domain S-box-containing protein
VRRAGVLSAIDTGQPTLTGPITLKQDERQRPGVLYLLPLYQGAVPPLNVAQRRTNLVGIYYAPIVIDDLMQGLFDTSNQQLNISLSDETGADPVEMFRADGDEAGEYGQRLTAQRTLAIAGRQYVLRTQANAAFEQRLDRSTPSWIVLGGSLLSALLALATWMLASARARTEAHAASLTTDLERLAEVARRTSNAVMITDPEMRVSWVNEGFTRLYGYSFDEAKGQLVRSLVGTPACPADRLAQLDASLARGEGCRVELLNRDKDGQTFWIDTEIQPRHNAQGELLGYIEITQNISDLKEATRRLEAAQRETDALLRTLNAHAVISVADRTGRIIEVNDAFCALSGYRRDELIGQDPPHQQLRGA